MQGIKCYRIGGRNMLRAKGKVWKATGSGKNCHVVYISADIVKDSQYPFKPKEKVNVELDPENQRLIVTKVK